MSAPNQNQSGGMVSNSVLVRYLTRFFAFLYRTFLAGWFGFFFTSYEAISEGFSSSVFVRKIKNLSNYRIFHFVRKLKRYAAFVYERSLFLSLVRGMWTRLLTARVNMLGCFFLCYGGGLFFIQLFKKFAVPGKDWVFGELVLCGFCAVVGCFMLMSQKSLANAVYESHFLWWLLFDCLGFPTISLTEATKKDVRGGFSVPIVLAILSAVLSFFVNPILLFAAALLFALLCALLASPESGVIVALFALPFLSTVQLCLFLGLIYFSYILKLICGRRLFHWHMIDCVILGFLSFLVFGGLVGIGASGALKMLLMVGFMGMYFVVKNIISSPAMVKRCLYALAGSSAIVAAYGIYQNYFGILSTKWQDMEMFFQIRGRVVSFFENPNVLGEFLILVFPITLALALTAKRSYERFFLGVVALLDIWCLIFTWSRGAWIGLIVAVLIFGCVYRKDFLTFVTLALPWFGVFVFLKKDSLILTRLTGFGDSSTSYRLGIWRGVARMLQDFGLYGIGIGEEAFTKVYPLYALAGMEAAPHAHNLYLQIAVEMGAFALAIFVAFILLYAQFSFSFCKSAMSRSNKSVCLGIFCGVLAILVQGMTDYVWYNYRIFLLFWMVVGLGFAHVYAAKNTEEEMDNVYC